MSNLRNWWPAGSVVESRGYMLQAKDLPGLNAADIERHLGFRPGRYAEGWFWLVLVDQPQESEVEVQGNTMYSDGVPAREIESFDQIGRRLPDYPWLKANIIRFWPLRGPNRWMKAQSVIPDQPGEVYPPGTGILQLRLNRSKRFRVIRYVGPSERLDRTSNEWKAALETTA